MDENEYKSFIKYCIENGYKSISKEQKECLKKAIDEAGTVEEFLAVFVTTVTLDNSESGFFD